MPCSKPFQDENSWGLCVFSLTTYNLCSIQARKLGTKLPHKTDRQRLQNKYKTFEKIRSLERLVAKHLMVFYHINCCKVDYVTAKMVSWSHANGLVQNSDVDHIRMTHWNSVNSFLYFSIFLYFVALPLVWSENHPTRNNTASKVPHCYNISFIFYGNSCQILRHFGLILADSMTKFNWRIWGNLWIRMII